MPELLRTWDDFYLHATRLYGKDEAKQLVELMKQHGITRSQILCFINHATGMTQQEIADALDITQQAVAKHISKVTEKWPYLMLNILPERVENYESWRHDYQIPHQF